MEGFLEFLEGFLGFSEIIFRFSDFSYFRIFWIIFGFSENPNWARSILGFSENGPILTVDFYRFYFLFIIIIIIIFLLLNLAVNYKMV